MTKIKDSKKKEIFSKKNCLLKKKKFSKEEKNSNLENRVFQFGKNKKNFFSIWKTKTDFEFITIFKKITTSKNRKRIFLLTRGLES